MELQRATPPPAFISHNPADLNFPSVPCTDVTHAHANAEITLPDLRTVLSRDFEETSYNAFPDHRVSHLGPASPTSVRSLPRIDPGPGYVNGVRKSMESAIASPSEGGSVMSVDEYCARSTSVSMDDPDVRIAAEALSGLGNPGRRHSGTLKVYD